MLKLYLFYRFFSILGETRHVCYFLKYKTVGMQSFCCLVKICVVFLFELDVFCSDPKFEDLQASAI